MSGTVIKVENLRKLYRLGEVGTGTLSHDLNRWWHRVRGKEDPYLKVGQRNDRATKGESDYVWALKDINFEVKQGEVLGIIGRNGAGKSTLLKILSRVTAPTAGTIKVNGRIASLLEVGTGFHPELTGRDNIYLNGAILGMRKQEIDRKFDEIVAFAEIDRYVDTPVKRYSSGMYVRLAFAVAAHLEPEILIVDEVLAVGDAAFQKKCLGKMQDVAGHGRTILFVSHNMTVITRLCSRCVLLEEGTIRLAADTASVVSSYLESGGGDKEKAEFRADTGNKVIGNDLVKLLSVSVRDPDGGTGPNFGAESPLRVEIRYEVLKPTRNLRVGFRLCSAEGIVVFTSTDTDSGNEEDALTQREAGVYASSCLVPACFLNRGQYTLSVGSDVAMVQGNFYCENIVSFSVEPVGGQLASKYDNRTGFVCPDLQWEVRRDSSFRR